jgi:hypothetical protein
MNFLTVAFISFFILGFKHTHTSDYQMETLRSFYWTENIPDIIVCNNAQVDILILEKAISSWEKRGEKIGNVLFKECVEGQTLTGTVEIYEDDKITGSAYGLTALKSYKSTKEIISAKIWIKSDYTDSIILLEHEIGHALGFRDTLANDHVMSSYGFVY